METLSRHSLYVLVFLGLGLIALPIFAHLDELPFQLWDESRNILNTLEILKNNEFIAVTFFDEPEFWNTKPPFLMWCQAGFISLFGLNETAARLPSAIAAFLSCVMIIWFFRSKMKQPLLGFLAAFVLVSGNGFLGYHQARGGDFDALLTLFLLSSSLCFYLFLLENKTKWLYLFFFGLTLAVMTKSVAGLMFGPAWFIWLLWEKKLLVLLKNKHFYFGSIGFALVVIGYYYWRNELQPGFWNAVVENELGGRYLETIEQHNHPFYFYIRRLSQNMPFYWLLLLPGIIYGWRLKQQKLQNFYRYMVFIAASFVLLISMSQTKLEWYDMPAFPWLAMLAALPLVMLYERGVKQIKKNVLWKKALIIGLLLMVVGIPYYQRLDQSLRVAHFNQQDEHHIGYFLKEALKGHFNIQEHYLINDDYDPHLVLYIKMLQAKGIQFSKKLPKEIAIGDKLIIYRAEDKQMMEQQYEYKFHYSYRTVNVYEVLGRKS